MMHVCFNVYFSEDVWVWIWISGARKTSIWRERSYKRTVSQKLELSSCQRPLLMMPGGIGTHFHDFGGLDAFSWQPCGTPRSCDPPGGRYIVFCNFNNSRVLETHSRDPESELGRLEIEQSVHRIYETLEHRITDDASQLGGPVDEGQFMEGSLKQTCGKGVCVCVC